MSTQHTQPDDQEREKFVNWLNGTYPRSHTKGEAEEHWQHGHISALAWKAGREEMVSALAKERASRQAAQIQVADLQARISRAGVEKRSAIYKAVKEALASAQAQPSLTDEQLHCEIAPQPLRYSLSDYHNAPSTGPLADTWTDKPHRLLYDLIAAVKHYAALATQAAQPEQIGKMNSGDETKGAVARFGLDCSGTRPAIVPATNGAFVWYSDYLKLFQQPVQAQAAQPESLAKALGDFLKAYDRQQSERSMISGQEAVLALASCRDALDAYNKSATEQPVQARGVPAELHAAVLREFKNFHRLLCDRFGYFHDERDWRRDQLSLIEFIAAPSPQQAHGVPEGYKLLGDGETAIPQDWTWCRIEHEPGYDEDVAFGPKRMMDRLKKWLDAYFALKAAASSAQQADKQRLDDYATEVNRLRNVIQAACSGGLDHMIERWKVLFPDAPVPAVRAAPQQAEPLSPDQVKAMLTAAGYDDEDEWKGTIRAHFINGLRHAEMAHGIGIKGAK